MFGVHREEEIFLIDPALFEFPEPSDRPKRFVGWKVTAWISLRQAFGSRYRMVCFESVPITEPGYPLFQPGYTLACVSEAIAARQ